MICKNCGTSNDENSKFCIKCGNSLIETNNVGVAMPNTTMNNPLEAPTTMPMGNNLISTPNIENPMAMPTMNNQPVTPNVGNNATNATVPNTLNNSNPSNASNSKFNFLTYFLAVILKPISSYEEEKDKFDTKNTVILSIICVAFMTIINIISTIIFTARVSSLISGYSSSWDFSRIKYINFFQVFGKSLGGSVAVILAIAGAFYIGSLIIKKEVKFMKCLSIVVTSIIPVIIGYLLIAPILGLLWGVLQLIVSVVSIAYFIIILYELMNKELKLENNMKVYFNLACFSTLIIVGYYVTLKFLLNSLF